MSKKKWSEWKLLIIFAIILCITVFFLEYNEIIYLPYVIFFIISFFVSLFSIGLISEKVLGKKYNIAVLIPIWIICNIIFILGYNIFSLKYGIIMSVTFLTIIIVILLEIFIGKLIGGKLTKDTGLILGIILLFLGVTLFLGIPIIVYSNKNKPAKTYLNEDNVLKINIEKFIDKNYKDILSENGLDEYISIFEEQKLTDVLIIAKLNDDELEKIGIKLMGDRKRIINIFSKE